MVQTIIESRAPTLPPEGGFTPEFEDFIASCLHKARHVARRPSPVYFLRARARTHRHKPTHPHTHKQDPHQRCTAEVLLRSPWLQKNGAVGLVQSVENVRVWISSLG